MGETLRPVDPGLPFRRIRVRYGTPLSPAELEERGKAGYRRGRLGDGLRRAVRELMEAAD